VQLVLNLPQPVFLAGHAVSAGQLALVDLGQLPLAASDPLASARHILGAALANPHLVEARLVGEPAPVPPAPAASDAE
jgi:hypothetical protein